MSAALTLLLIGSLLQGALCGEFKAFMPQNIEVLSGSCVTIPCSFDIEDRYKLDLDKTCRALWKIDVNTVVFDSSHPQTSTIKGKLIGDLKKKDCTTTLNNMQPAHNNDYYYYFRLECSNKLIYNFWDKRISFSVKDVPPRPTLTPSALKVEEGTSVNLTCSAPAPCLSHPPTLTWTKGLGDGVETLQENRDKTKVMTSVVTFTASQKHHGETISCTAIYNKQDGSTASAVSESLTAHISFEPQILSSSDCFKAADQLNCSCRTEGNPLPTILWYLDGLPVNHSDNFLISTERRNDTGLWSIITVNGPRERDPSTLLCRSSNSLGSASQRFCVKTSAQSQDRLMPVFITAVGFLLLLVCFLLFVIRAQKTHHNLLKSQLTGDSSRVTMSHLLTSAEGNEVPNATEEDIYVNNNEVTCADVAHPSSTSEPNSTTLPSSGPNNAERARKSSEKTDEEGKDVIYSNLNWKAKSNKKKAEDSKDMHQPGSSYLEEEMCMAGGRRSGFVSNALEMGSMYDNFEPQNVVKEVESEYAQVKFKDKSAILE
ncbi:sialic acid-binding Ig-like lectin 14 isoform X3 [Anoplopoma fimbria]|uniref:sialic acid-binding Ig-like lectin 14 isoform X3 n=1 Tax=Anoplopoma fimbria TaxID=229290 RepID=UPI0023EDE790|nr:sialic acid-binding Ig-like lectin 14 isoform X3 [Anoplopoma fimbria]